MLGKALLVVGLALSGTSYALPLEQQVEQVINANTVAAGAQLQGAYGDLHPNSGWQPFAFGPVNSTVSPIFFRLYCAGVMKITDFYCSGDQFAVYDNGVYLGTTSTPVFNNCTSNTTDPHYAFTHSEWSHGTFELLPGFHNITLRVVQSPFGEGYGAIRVDTHAGDKHCSLDVCPYSKDNLVVVNTTVSRCEADSICKSMGMHLANIDIHNFLDATTLAYQCVGPFTQSWIDDWNGDEYMGSCLVLSTANAAPGGAINVPSCCTTRLPVICQRNPHHHPHPIVKYSCKDCHKSCYYHHDRCHSCHDSHCSSCSSCHMLD